MTFTGYRLYSGSGGLGQVDFSSAIAQADSTAQQISLVGAASASGRVQSYVLRAVLNDVESPDISCSLTLGRDDSCAGLWPLKSPLENISVTAAAGGKLQFRWYLAAFTEGDLIEIRLHRRPHCPDGQEADLSIAATRTGWYSTELVPPDSAAWYGSVCLNSISGPTRVATPCGPVAAMQSPNTDHMTVLLETI